ncbi:MAG TPA: hypothetical protein VFJ91_10205 [Gaiellaceae bacterium]|nr:hypothetical protein [Gaiellaceae bacterium]
MKRSLLLGVAVLLCATALLAIGILLVGHFGSVEERILSSALGLAGYGLVALPSAMLLERRRGERLAELGLGLAALAAAVSLVALWAFPDSDTAGRMVLTATMPALAAAQAAAVTARRREDDSIAVRRLHPVSCATGAVLALFVAFLVWTEPQASIWPRLAGALLVLDVLLVALQPVLARAATGGGRPPRAAAPQH